MKSLGYISLIILLCLAGCREPFLPEIEKYEDLLVIDGLITDQPGQTMVRLTRSFAFDESYPRPEEGAVVIILDENETPLVCNEVSPGIYRTDSTYQGKRGQSYKLLVTTAGGGESYESDRVILKPVPPIDSITYHFEEREGAHPGDLSSGMQIKVSTHDPGGLTRYYRWEWRETWEILTPMKSPLYVDEEICWKSGSTGLISIGTTEQLSEDILLEHPVLFVSNQTNRLKICYSVEVMQYSLSRDAYSYWKKLQDINQNTGSLFDPTPAMVYGNMHSIEGQDKAVLGLFQASSVSRERIFINREELPYVVDIPTGFEGCVFYETSNAQEIAYYQENNFPFAGTYTNGDALYYIFANSEACFRCTISGSKEKPDYWPE